MDEKTFIESKKQILNLVKDAKIDLATTKLMDFIYECTDDNVAIRRATAIRSQYNYNEEQSIFQTSETISIQRNILVDKLLKFLDSINYASIKPAPLQEQPILTGNEPTPEVVDFESILLKRKDNSKKNVSPDILFSCSGIEKRYSDFHLGPINLTCRKGEITGILGENGSGKTTLLNIIGGKLTQSKGELNYHFTNSDNWYVKKQDIAFLSQELSVWNDNLLRSLQIAAAVHGFRNETNTTLVDRIIYRLRLEDYVDKKWNQISGGYKTRFELARLLIRSPKMLILDEPLAHLDINAQQILLRDLKDFAKSEKSPMTILVSSQHIYEVESISNNILFMHQGKDIYNGRKSNINQERKVNLFELECDMDALTLSRELKTLDLSVILTEWGTHYIVETPISIGESVIIDLLLKKGISISYFRNISNSIRSHFLKDYQK